MRPHVGPRRTLKREVARNGEGEIDHFTRPRPDGNRIAERHHAWLSLQFARLEAQLLKSVDEVLGAHLLRDRRRTVSNGDEALVLVDADFLVGAALIRGLMAPIHGDEVRVVGGLPYQRQDRARSSYAVRNLEVFVVYVDGDGMRAMVVVLLVMVVVVRLHRCLFLFDMSNLVRIA